MSTTSVEHKQEFPFIIRVLWFFLVGWYLALPWILVAWFLNLTVIGLPLGLWMLNRVPFVLTLRTQSAYDLVTTGPDGKVIVQHKAVEQPVFGLRVLYFALVGWWLSLLWSVAAWALCVSIVGIPLGAWMFNRLPKITTLRQM